MRIFILLSPLLLLLSCQPAAPDLEEWIAEVMQRSGGPITPAPALPSPLQYSLPMPAPKDPFNPVRATPITLEYLGRIFIGDRVWAVIRSTEGQMHSLQVGDLAPYPAPLALIRISKNDIELATGGQTHRIERAPKTGRPLP